MERRLNNIARALSAWKKNHFGLTHIRIWDLVNELKRDAFDGETGRARLRMVEDELRTQR